MRPHVREERLLLALVESVVDGDSAAEHSPLLALPVTARCPVHLMDGAGVPDEHVASLGPELDHVVLVLRKVSVLKRHKHLVLSDVLVLVRAAQVDGSPVLRRGVVHGDPEAEGVEGAAVSRRQRAVLVVLVPLEALVGVDHEEVCRDADLVLASLVTLREPPALRSLTQHGCDGRVVEEVGEPIVGRPCGSLDVVIEARGDARDSPDVRVLDLPLRVRAKVVDPLLRQHVRNVHNAVLTQNVQVLLGDRVRRERRLSLHNLDGKGDVRVLLPPRILGEQINDSDRRLRGLGGRLQVHLSVSRGEHATLLREGAGLGIFPRQHHVDTACPLRAQ
mmetsp:Transcript_6784/g.15793  ORF Transcript_6784/g.15793 Transcript_6784/m.15793 type:complete len:334 (-) Transcript_6784:412-1413(-)